MKNTAVAISTLLLVYLTPICSYAESGNSLAVLIGMSQLSIKNSLTEEELTENGATFGMDFQRKFGFVSILISGNEIHQHIDITDQPDVSSIKVAMISVETRFWFDPLFLGVYYGKLLSVLIESGGDISNQGSGRARGLSIGLEMENGLFFSLHQNSKEKISHKNDLDIDIAGSVISIGYRWK